ncbi:NUDIX hydrolase [Streptomyces sp. TRM66268-LWL]|uniref:NUDIX hydrolase n=1 Tax=Streptomyces polyasparticus TaxID=2767826 RepID=A0ABR7SL65_9ACTN|nr:NUDIX hydrolase [Streptomyces polyasparticus]
MAVLARQGRVLVIRRGPGARAAGYWAPLSGTIEAGESQADALVREVREEVGLEVTPLAKVWECPTEDGSFLLHWWTASFDDTPLALDPDEVSEARWVTAEEFAELHPTFDGDRPFFDDVLPTLGLVVPEGPGRQQDHADESA